MLHLVLDAAEDFGDGERLSSPTTYQATAFHTKWTRTRSFATSFPHEHSCVFKEPGRCCAMIQGFSSYEVSSRKTREASEVEKLGRK